VTRSQALKRPTVRRSLLGGSIAVALLVAVLIPLALHHSNTDSRLAADEPSLVDNFSDDPDGLKTRTDSGLAVSLFPIDSPRTPRVDDGALTFDDTEGVLGGYYIIELPDVRNAKVDFSFTPWSKGGGLVCLAFMESDIALSSPVVPRSPLHFTLSPTNWSVDVFDTKGDAARTVVEGSFDPPLSANGTEVYTMGVRLDQAKNVAEISLPTGEIFVAADPSFGIEANFAYIETWRTTADSDETLARVRAWSADSAAEFSAD